MARSAPSYDLMLLLDPAAEEQQRARILADVEQAIGADGSLIARHDYGQRPTTFEIRHKPEAIYHLLQFHGSPNLLEQLERTLRITDGVLRFRIIRLPEKAMGAPASLATVRTEGRDRDGRDRDGRERDGRERDGRDRGERDGRDRGEREARASAR